MPPFIGLLGPCFSAPLAHRLRREVGHILTPDVPCATGQGRSVMLNTAADKPCARSDTMTKYVRCQWFQTTNVSQLGACHAAISFHLVASTRQQREFLDIQCLLSTMLSGLCCAMFVNSGHSSLAQVLPTFGTVQGLVAWRAGNAACSSQAIAACGSCIAPTTSAAFKAGCSLLSPSFSVSISFPFACCCSAHASNSASSCACAVRTKAACWRHLRKAVRSSSRPRNMQ